MTCQKETGVALSGWRRRGTVGPKRTKRKDLSNKSWGIVFRKGCKKTHDLY